LVCLLALAFWFALLTTSGWVVVLTMWTVLLYLIGWRPEPLLMAVAAAQVALLAYTHRAELARPPGLRLARLHGNDGQGVGPNQHQE
jgi:hypothetical protein